MFPPKATWNIGYAMDRNSVIYGMAKEIYVAQSSDGGTWSGVMDALKNKKRQVYIRKPDFDEKNANAELLKYEGAIAVGHDGRMISEPIYKANEIQPDIVQEDNPELKIIESISKKALTIKEILKKTGIGWKDKKLRDFLAKNSNVNKIKGKATKYVIEQEGQMNMF